jgi:hypothetical protein
VHNESAFREASLPLGESVASTNRTMVSATAHLSCGLPWCGRPFGGKPPKAFVL